MTICRFCHSVSCFPGATGSYRARSGQTKDVDDWRDLIRKGSFEEKIIVVTKMAEPGLEDILGKGLDEFNEHAAGLNDRRPLNVIVRDRGQNRRILNRFMRQLS